MGGNANFRRTACSVEQFGQCIGCYSNNFEWPCEIFCLLWGENKIDHTTDYGYMLKAHWDLDWKTSKYFNRFPPEPLSYLGYCGHAGMSAWAWRNQHVSQKCMPMPDHCSFARGTHLALSILGYWRPLVANLRLAPRGPISDGACNILTWVSQAF